MSAKQFNVHAPNVIAWDFPDLDPDGGRDLHLRVADAITNAIRSGVLRQGDRLPNVTEIARRYKVGDGTAHRALRVLAAANVVRHQRWRGFYVRGGLS